MLTAVFCVAEGSLGWTLHKQRQSATFPTTEGTIVSSRKILLRGARGSGYSAADIAYAYTVGDRHLTSSRFSFEHPAPRLETPETADLEKRFPVGTKISVHYNPADPSEAVLETSATPDLPAMMVFLLFFACIAIMLWCRAASMLHRALVPPLAGGLRLVHQHDATLIRVRWLSPIAVAAACVWITFVVTLLALTFSGHRVDAQAELLTIAAGLAIGAIGAYCAAVDNRHNARYIRIDPSARTITLPAHGDRTERTIPAAHIRHVQPTWIARGRSGARYLRLTIRSEGAAEETEQVRVTGDLLRAEGLTNYLRDRLKVLSTQ